MKRKYAIIFALLLCCTIVLTSCSDPLASIKEFFNKETETAENADAVVDDQQSLSEVIAVQPENARATVMYYKDSDNLLVPVMRYVSKSELGIAKSTISALIYSPEKAEDLKPTGLKLTLPTGTKINGAVIKENGHIIVDFSKEFQSFTTKEAEEIGVKSVIYTLTEFANIKTVEIRVDGKTITELPKGTKLNAAMKRTEINLQPTENKDDKLSKVMVYYQKKGKANYSYFVPVTKLVSGTNNSVEAALTALLEAPAAECGLVNPFPEGTKLIEVKVNDGVAFVNLTEDVLKLQGNKSAERAMIKAVSLTLREFPTISKIKLFVNGTVVENSDGVGANEYINVPVFVNFYE